MGWPASRQHNVDDPPRSRARRTGQKWQQHLCYADQSENIDLKLLANVLHRLELSRRSLGNPGIVDQPVQMQPRKLLVQRLRQFLDLRRTGHIQQDGVKVPSAFT